MTGLIPGGHERLASVHDFIGKAVAPTECLFVPTYHDVTGTVPPSEGQPLLHRQAVSGWQEPVAGIIHIYTIESVVATLTEDDIRKARIPDSCRHANHLHVFALHQPILAEVIFPVTRQQGGLDHHQLTRLAGYGYDLVLGHHPGRSSAASAEFTNGLWIIRPPARGLNLIDAAADGSFKVFVIQHANGTWRSQPVASRNYEEARTRRWRHQRQHGPTCEFIDVRIENYQAGSEAERHAQRQCGDLAVTITLHRPEKLEARLPLPLSQVAAYHGIAWRDIKASFVGGTSPEALSINADGTINVAHHEGQDIQVTGVILNAVPTQPGDWLRMRASHAELLEPFLIEPRLSARFMRVRVDWPELRHRLRPVGRRGGNHEGLEHDFAAVRGDDTRRRQDLLVFRPLAGVGYALSLDKAVDPIADTQSTRDPGDIVLRQKAIRELRNSMEAPHHLIRQALNTLREQIVELAKHLRPDGSNDDISVDLISVDRGLTVEMTDYHTEIWVRDNLAQNPVGISFAWGQGIAGRALRLMREYAWSRQNASGHASTWPADNWYHQHANMAVHTHVYCRPVVTLDDDEPYAIAMLSIATHKHDSGLAHIIKQLRQSGRDANIDVRAVCDAAVATFSDSLNEQLSKYLSSRMGETYDTTD